MSTLQFIKTHTMYRQRASGTKHEVSEFDALLWIAKNVKTVEHARLVEAGVPTAMIDGSMVFFEKKKGGGEE